MLFAATGALRCSSLRLSALRTTTARRSVALHATTSAARQARRSALNEANASNPHAGKTVADLKELLRARGLPVSGVKAALLDRLAASDGGSGALASAASDGGPLSASPPRRADAALKPVDAAEAPPPSPPKKSEPTGRPFATLGLSSRLAANLESQLGEDARMTPIQELAFPAARRGDDVVARAQTGTGKTLAFLVPSLERLETDLNNRRPALVVLSPTRELAQQIHAQAMSLCEGLGLRCGCVVGGTSKGGDLRRLRRGVDILCATPGRLCDLLGEDAKLLRGTKTLVLDEGDRLLDEGFERQLSQIIEASSRSRQTLCFSATMPADLKRMLDSGAVRSEYERVDATGAAGGADLCGNQISGAPRHRR